jgi:molybdenum cofactor biosynthesis protein B
MARSATPSSAQHRRAAAGQTALCGVLTISDTRTPATDTGGQRIVEALEGAGHAIAHYRIVPDEPHLIQGHLEGWVEEGLDLVVTTGGTGISSRDTTIEVVERLLDKRIEGFGELFRMLSWEQVGAAAMLSRAVGGLAGETLVFSLPGSPNAVALALEKLLIPELAHLLWERRR